jgi:hypothetical protein
MYPSDKHRYFSFAEHPISALNASGGLGERLLEQLFESFSKPLLLKPHSYFELWF